MSAAERLSAAREAELTKALQTMLDALRKSQTDMAALFTPELARDMDAADALLAKVGAA